MLSRAVAVAAAATPLHPYAPILALPANADLNPQTVARPEYQRMIDAGQEPDRRKVNKTAAERGSTKSTSEAKADGGEG